MDTLKITREIINSQVAFLFKSLFFHGYPRFQQKPGVYPLERDRDDSAGNEYPSKCFLQALKTSTFSVAEKWTKQTTRASHWTFCIQGIK
jgi:hypothetical protein